MENFCWQREALDLLARHYQTNECLPGQLYEKMIAAKNFQSAMQMMRQIEFALFDMRLHGEFEAEADETVQDYMDEVRREVAVVVHPPFNRFQNSFNHIFAGGYAAGYYSYKWAEVLAADAFSLFEEKGVFDRGAEPGCDPVFQPGVRCIRFYVFRHPGDGAKTGIGPADPSRQVLGEHVPVLSTGAPSPGGPAHPPGGAYIVPSGKGDPRPGDGPALRANTWRTRIRRWLRPPRKLRPTRPGWLFFAVTFGVGFAALNTGNNLLYLVLALMLAGMGMSLRKRWKRVRLGNYAWWRVLHLLTGVLALIVLVAHTGMSLGEELNRALLSLVLVVLGTGALVGVLTVLENRYPHPLTHRLKAWLQAGHIALAWPIPVLLGIHIVSAYYF